MQKLTKNYPDFVILKKCCIFTAKKNKQKSLCLKEKS